MEKQELLKKARQENKTGDERMQLLETKSYANAFWTIMTCSGIYYIYSLLCLDADNKTHQYVMGMGIIGLATYYASRYYYFRKKRDLCSGIFFCIGALGFLYFLFTGMNIGSLWM